MSRAVVTSTNRVAVACYGFLASGTAPVRFATTSTAPATSRATKPRAPRTSKAASSKTAPIIATAIENLQTVQSTSVPATRKRANSKTATVEDDAIVAYVAPVKATRGRKKQEIELADEDVASTPTPAKRTRASTSKSATVSPAKAPTTRKKSAAMLAREAAAEEAAAAMASSTPASTSTSSPSPAAPALAPTAIASNPSKPALARATPTLAATATQAPTSTKKTTTATRAAAEAKKKKVAAAASSTVTTPAPEAVLSVASRFASAKSTPALANAPTPMLAPEESAYVVASQEEAMAELKRLRLAVAPPSTPQPTPGSILSGAQVASTRLILDTNESDQTATGASGADASGAVNIVDTPEYKKATRQWTSLIVAMPILLVTSYYLFDRLALGHMPTDLTKYREKLQDAVDRLGEAATNALSGENRPLDGASSGQKGAPDEKPL
ncbi:hypothetical protein SEPCBS57363_001170 [Sporothrix epigloea]|uniref:Uncharacterized protein n=1 Tax=Sporothrix epigloea TaxID=1892477 RepID=A0ABP0D8T9_9PEZI